MFQENRANTSVAGRRKSAPPFTLVVSSHKIMSTLSHRTEKLIVHLFSPDARTAVHGRLESECGTEALGCPGWTPEEMERIRFAVLKLGVKDESSFESAITLATTDWRDLLMAAGFGKDLEAHNKWWQSCVC